MHAADLEQDLHRLIPISAAMELAVAHIDDTSLILRAPLAKNHNHAGSGFAGSIYSTASLAGWALLRVCVLRHQLDHCQLVLADAHMRYLRPVQGDIVAHARLPMDDQATIVERLRQGRKVRQPLTIHITTPDHPDAIMEGAFAALPATPST